MSNAFTAGDVLRFAIQVTDSTGALANASSASLVVVRPDGTETAALTPTNTATGVYQYDYTTTADMWGRYLGEWSTNGTNAGGEPQSFFVLPKNPPVTVSEAKDWLEITGDSSDGAIAITIGAAMAVLEHLGQPIVPRTVTKTFDGGRSIMLPSRINAITQVVENGVTLAPSQYVCNTSAGILKRGSTAAAGPFAPGFQNVSVTWTVGSVQVEPNVQTAIHELVRYLWRQVHGNPQSFSDGFVPQAAISGMSEAMRDRVMTLLGAKSQAFGF